MGVCPACSGRRIAHETCLNQHRVVRCEQINKQNCLFHMCEFPPPPSPSSSSFITRLSSLHCIMDTGSAVNGPPYLQYQQTLGHQDSAPSSPSLFGGGGPVTNQSSVPSVEDHQKMLYLWCDCIGNKFELTP